MANFSAADKRRVARWVLLWQKRLLLDGWQVTVEAAYEPCPTDEDVELSITLAGATALPNYLSVAVTIYPAFWKCTRAEQQQTIVHELVHALTERTRQLMLSSKLNDPEAVEHENEQLTEWIAQIALRAYSRKKKTSK